MEQEFFDKIIAPTLSARAIFIGITTLGEDKERNFVNELMEIEDDNGEKLFRTIDLKMVCDRCLRLGKEMQCRHRMGQLPYWQDSKRHNDIQKMLEGRSDTYLLEMRGVQTDKWTRPAFDHAAVERVFSETEEVTYSHSNFIKHIFVAVDPSAGGAKSNYAIISCFYTSTGKVVVRCSPPSLSLSFSLSLLGGLFCSRGLGICNASVQLLRGFEQFGVVELAHGVQIAELRQAGDEQLPRVAVGDGGVQRRDVIGERVGACERVQKDHAFSVRVDGAPVWPHRQCDHGRQVALRLRLSGAGHCFYRAQGRVRMLVDRGVFAAVIIAAANKFDRRGCLAPPLCRVGRGGSRSRSRSRRRRSASQGRLLHIAAVQRDRAGGLAAEEVVA
jgi:hypothetical protein